MSELEGFAVAHELVATMAKKLEKAERKAAEHEATIHLLAASAKAEISTLRAAANAARAAVVLTQSTDVRSVEWLDEGGCPDALYVTLANGYNFTIRHIPAFGFYRIFEGDFYVNEESETILTGLSRADLNALGDVVRDRYAAHQQDVE